MLTDMVTTLLLFHGFRVTRDPVETGYVRVVQGLRSNSLVLYGIRLQNNIFSLLSKYCNGGSQNMCVVTRKYVLNITV